MDDLKELYDRASKIPSKSNQVFVKCAILEAVGEVEKDDNFIKMLVQDINNLIEQLPVFEEQMERLQMFFNALVMLIGQNVRHI